MTTDQTDTMQAPSRELFDTLLDRWQEVADAYRNDPPRDDLDQRYADYRHVYLRNIRDLRHVLDTGRMPCSLMNDGERRRGDCGRNHEDEYEEHGELDDDPWAADSTLASLVAFRRVVAGHLAEMFLGGPTGDLYEWARGIAREAKRAGVDIDDDIVACLRTLTLGTHIAEEPPF
ncbi:hypothetical protein [Streptomyces sp. SID8352]|uniref:hypothetical protein n=1 Tax=Streptomyces sp. SID8352 TaxID=2690338 RepID=UPI001367CF54|nr:hypothetical protein [Streptomyces sp. SID8352]MYU20768.1 hypothetical protein [Streptomyces sp. SID8352]